MKGNGFHRKHDLIAIDLILSLYSSNVFEIKTVFIPEKISNFGLKPEIDIISDKFDNDDDKLFQQNSRPTKSFKPIFGLEYCLRFSPSQISDTPQVGFEPA